MKLKSEEIIEIFERFKKQNPAPRPELEYSDNYTLLVAVVLSAQTTDKSVNKVTEKLFKLAPVPQKMVRLGAEKVEEIIRPIGLSKNKSKNVVELSKQLIENFNGTVPDTMKELLSLSGVGRKTANVVLNVAFGKKVMPVDTHVLRVSQRIGFSDCDNPEEMEKVLVEKIPSEYMKHAHHWLILHGRYVCTARAPKCEECIIKDICKLNRIK
ncbi:MAG: endonuclease III [Treponema sp.]|nr:endonuclease III [Candidatus Treponema merdequi]